MLRLALAVIVLVALTVPNLVAVVRGSAAHEERTLQQVTQARAAATGMILKADDLEDPAKMAAFAKAQDEPLSRTTTRSSVTSAARSSTA